MQSTNSSANATSVLLGTAVAAALLCGQGMLLAIETVTVLRPACQNKQQQTVLVKRNSRTCYCAGCQPT